MVLNQTEMFTVIRLILKTYISCVFCIASLSQISYMFEDEYLKKKWVLKKQWNWSLINDDRRWVIRVKLAASNIWRQYLTKWITGVSQKA